MSLRPAFSSASRSSIIRRLNQSTSILSSTELVTYHCSLRTGVSNKAIHVSTKEYSAKAETTDSDEDKMTRLPTKRFAPTLETVRDMPVSLHEANNDVLVTVASMGNKDALEELLKRHIMQRDHVEYDDATETFKKIAAANRRGMTLFSTPNKLGLAVALVAGFGSFPLVFDSALVHRFNDKWVTTDIPEPADLETMLEIGMWSWNWMEPPLGTLSFFLLCLQFGRSQLENLGLRPFSMKMKQIRAERLVKEFPEYDSKLLMSYSKADNYYN